MKLILDFDRVIFNFDAYIADVQKHGLTDIYVTPRVWDVLKVTDYLFSDAMAFIKNIPKEDMTIISAMSPHLGPEAREYQRRKLAESGMDTYVSKIIVMEGDKAPYVEEHYVPGVVTVFIDDKVDHLWSVKNHIPEIVCIQLVRPGGSLESGISDSREIPVVEDFAGVNAIIKTL